MHPYTCKRKTPKRFIRLSWNMAILSIVYVNGFFGGDGGWGEEETKITNPTTIHDINALLNYV